MMPQTLLIKGRIVGTPLESVALWFRWLGRLPWRWRHPELAELHHNLLWHPNPLKKLLRPDSNVVDVGAHLGSFINVAQRIAPLGHHIAVEASKPKALALQRRFTNIEVHAVAASDTQGTSTFYDDLSGRSRLNHAMEGFKACEVPTTTIDLIVAGRPIHLLKIDIEGHEFQALRGAVNSINNNRPVIIFEYGSEYYMQKIGGDRREIYDLLTELGYGIHTFLDVAFDRGPMLFDEFRRCGLYPFRAFNFVAMPRD